MCIGSRVDYPLTGIWIEIIGSGRIVGNKSGDVDSKIRLRLVLGISTPISVISVISLLISIF